MEPIKAQIHEFKKIEEQSFQFHMKEYDALRIEIMTLDSSKRNLQILAFGSSGAIWSFIAGKANKDDIISIILSILPILIFISAKAMCNYYINCAKKIGSYIQKIEERYADSELGWESFIRTREFAMTGFVTSDSRNRMWDYWISLLIIMFFVNNFKFLSSAIKTFIS